MSGVDFHSASGGFAAEFAVVGGWVPEVIEVFAVVRCEPGIVVHGMWVELGVGVGAPHVSGFGGFGCVGGDLVDVGGVYADKLTFLGK